LAASREIEAQLEEAMNQESAKVKLLLLGAGESGKSTIFKQMKILYGLGFVDAEREQYKRYVFSNIIEAMKAICEACETFGMKSQVKAAASFDAIMNTSLGDEVSEELGAHIEMLWNDSAIQSAWGRRNEYQVIETTKAYFDRIRQISAFGYIPSQEDILLARVRTSGIVEERYEIDGTIFEMYDVGGQRNERKKWIHCFDEVNAVIFVAALSEYDQVLFEDDTTNRMMEAILLFEDICNNRWFADTAMILFLNKRDLFEEKVRDKPITSVSQFAEDFTGDPCNYDDGISYFKSKFLAVNKKNKDIYVHVTCATDSDNVEVVFRASKEIILKANLDDNGFIG